MGVQKAPEKSFPSIKATESEQLKVFKSGHLWYNFNLEIKKIKSAHFKQLNCSKIDIANQQRLVSFAISLDY